MPSSFYTVFIDGYNCIKPHPRLKTLPLETARGCLIALAQQVRWPMPVGRVVLVFDGPEYASQQPAPKVRVVFSAPTADGYILNEIRTAKDYTHCVLISNDRELTNAAKAYRWKAYSTQWFFGRAQLKAGSRQREDSALPNTASERKIPLGQEQQITAELRRLWVEKSKPH